MKHDAGEADDSSLGFGLGDDLLVLTHLRHIFKPIFVICLLSVSVASIQPQTPAS